MKLDKREPCRQCPFRRESLPGWLGPWEAGELLFSLGTQAFPCHLTIREDGHDLGDATLQGCAGAAIFLNNKVEMSKNPLTAEHQALVKGAAEEVKGSVFANGNEFRRHHYLERRRREKR